MSSDQMVVFPENGGEWRDSGEGGLFVILVALKPENHSFNCSVDVEPSITMPQPDATIHPRRGTLWLDWDSTESRNWQKLESLVWQDERFAGEYELKNAVARGINPAAQSDAVLAAIHMGSTYHSLWSEARSSYFVPGYEHLTQNGKTIFDGLRLAFGAAPELYTFLDT